MDLPRLIGIVGLLLIVSGVLARKPGRRNTAFALGGIALFLYSIAIGDDIFAFLQVIFTGSATYELWRERNG